MTFAMLSETDETPCRRPVYEDEEIGSAAGDLIALTSGLVANAGLVSAGLVRPSSSLGQRADRPSLDSSLRWTCW